MANGQWAKINIQTNESFRGLKSHKNDIWATGTGGTIIHSKDGGENWNIQKIKGAEKQDFRDLCLINEKTILVMSAGLSEKSQAKIYRTTDGGENWNLAFELNSKGYFFDAIQFDKQSNQGLVVSDPVDGEFKFFTFDAKGENFSPIQLKKFPKLQIKEAAFAASGSSLLYQEGIATLVTGGGKYARVIQSDVNDLTNWEVKNQIIESDSTSGFFSIGINGKKEMLVAGGNYLKMNENKIPILMSNDHGKTWTKNEVLPSFYIEKVIWSKPNWIITGPSETAIYHAKTKKWNSLGKTPFHNIIEINGYLIGVGGKGEIGRFKLK